MNARANYRRFFRFIAAGRHALATAPKRPRHSQHGPCETPFQTEMDAGRGAYAFDRESFVASGQDRGPRDSDRGIAFGLSTNRQFRRSSFARIVSGGAMKLLLAGFFCLVFSAYAQAARAVAAPSTLSSFGINAAASSHGTTLGVPMQIALGLTLLTLLPGAIMCVTPFLRITVVLHFLRQALGTQTAPSNQVLLGLSLFLSMLVVQPMFAEIYTKAWQPLEKGEITTEQAMDQGSAPLRKFLLRFARERDIHLFVEIAKEPAPHNENDVNLKVLIPAYILSELKAGFQIGAVLFLPFLVIDIAVASVTLSIGMMQLPPAMVSAPFKILLFVLVDGWNLVIGSLMKSFF